MAKARRSHDIVFRNTDGSSNEVGVNLWSASNEVPGGYDSRIIPIHPDEGSTPATQQNSYDDTSPNLDLVYEQTSWHRGLGQPGVRRRGEDDFRYATADGVLAQFEGQVVSGYYEDKVDVCIRNPRFEDAIAGAATNWTASNLSLSTDSTNHRSGNQALGITVSSNNGTITQRYGGSSTPFRSKSITLRAYIKRLTGSGTVRANLIDSAGTTNGSTSSATSYAQIEVTRTINSGATTIDFQFEFSNATDTWVIDDASLQLPGNSVDFNSDGVTLSDEFYIPCGRTVMKWSSADVAFYPVYIDAAYSIESIIEFDHDSASPALFIGFGSNQVYKYSTNGTTWAAPSTTSSNNKDYASHLAVTRDANGDISLAKSVGVEVRVSSGNIVSSTANWGNAITVGSSDKSVTNLVSSSDILYVGKTDGLYKYDRATNKFEDLEPEAGAYDHPNNYKAAIGRGGKIFAGTGARSFFAVTDKGDLGFEFQDLSDLVRSNSWDGFSGEVEAITQDKANIWVALNNQQSAGFPYAFPIDFRPETSDTRVVVLRPETKAVGAQDSTNLVPNAITTVVATAVARISRFIQAVQQDSVFIFGQFTNPDSDAEEARIVRLRVPVDNENPARTASDSIYIRKSGTLTTPWIDWFYPDISKTLVKLTAVTKNLSSTKTIAVSYKVDDATVGDDTGWTSLGTLNASPTDTVTASLTNTVDFRRVRFRFAFSSSDTDEPLELYSYTIHAVFNPVESRKWTIQTKLSDNKRSKKGRKSAYRSTLSSLDLTNLDSLRQDPFCVFEDKDGSSYRVKIRQLQERVVELGNPSGGANPKQTRVVHLEMNEVRTS
tara:strand:- start:404 stop:2896 length:2493 start_codon:yes stop_codon:yes gene_type:complete